MSVRSLAESMLCMQNLLRYRLRSTWSWSLVRDPAASKSEWEKGRWRSQRASPVNTRMPLRRTCRDWLESWEVGCLHRNYGVWEAVGRGRSWTALGMHLSSALSYSGLCSVRTAVWPEPKGAWEVSQRNPVLSPACPGWPLNTSVVSLGLNLQGNEREFNWLTQFVCLFVFYMTVGATGYNT